MVSARLVCRGPGFQCRSSHAGDSENRVLLATVTSRDHCSSSFARGQYSATKCVDSLGPQLLFQCISAYNCERTPDPDMQSCTVHVAGTLSSQVNKQQQALPSVCFANPPKHTLVNIAHQRASRHPNVGRCGKVRGN